MILKPKRMLFQVSPNFTHMVFKILLEYVIIFKNHYDLRYYQKTPGSRIPVFRHFAISTLRHWQVFIELEILK